MLQFIQARTVNWGEENHALRDIDLHHIPLRTHFCLTGAVLSL
jgi:hypothetical protein